MTIPEATLRQQSFMARIEKVFKVIFPEGIPNNPDLNSPHRAVWEKGVEALAKEMGLDTRWSTIGVMRIPVFGEPLLVDALTTPRHTREKAEYPDLADYLEKQGLRADTDYVRLTLSHLKRKLEDSVERHPTPITSRHEAYGVLFEEVDECWEEIKKSTAGYLPAVLGTEMLDVASVAIRTIIDLHLLPDAQRRP